MLTSCSVTYLVFDMSYTFDTDELRRIEALKRASYVIGKAVSIGTVAGPMRKKVLEMAKEFEVYLRGEND